MRARRRDSPLPRREGDNERRGGEPGKSQPSWPAIRACKQHLPQRQSLPEEGYRGSFQRASPDRAVAPRGSRRCLGGVVPGQRGRKCGRGRPDGTRLAERPFDPANHYTSKYLDSSNEPLVPFGFGLTYGRFTLSNLTVSPREVTAD